MNQCNSLRPPFESAESLSGRVTVKYSRGQHRMFKCRWVERCHNRVCLSLGILDSKIGEPSEVRRTCPVIHRRVTTDCDEPSDQVTTLRVAVSVDVSSKSTRASVPPSAAKCMYACECHGAVCQEMPHHPPVVVLLYPRCHKPLQRWLTGVVLIWLRPLSHSGTNLHMRGIQGDLHIKADVTDTKLLKGKGHLNMNEW